MRVFNLGVLRCRAGLTQEQLAERSGICKDTISKLESGVRPTAQAVTAGKLAGALGVDAAELSTASAGLEPEGYSGTKANAVEKRLELFEIGEDLDERRLDLVLGLARELALGEPQRGGGS